MRIFGKRVSDDHKSIKVLQLTDDEFLIETGILDDNDTCHLCVSSQIGCPISCQMCYNGVNKNYRRNLSMDEIVHQVINIVETFKIGTKYKNLCISFMGVGEPLLNYDNVLKSIKILESKYNNISFALATTLPKFDDIYRLTKDFNEINNFKLTISLHAPNDIKRKKLIPTHTSMEDLRSAMDYFKKYSKHKCEFNYVLLKDFNDSIKDFNELICFLELDDRIKISSYNEIENGKFYKSDIEKYELLHLMLDKLNIHNSKFESIGDKIDVGCGQMAAKKLKKR